MPGMIKYKPVDFDKKNKLIKSYYIALPVFYTGLFCKAFLRLHKAIREVVDISIKALEEDCFSLRDKGEDTIRYFRLIPLSLREEITIAWKRFYAVLPTIVLRNDKIKKLDATIQSLSVKDIIEEDHQCPSM